MFKGIDFYSDTMTRPSPGMRKAIMEAEVGDEQMGEDPTTLRLETMAAQLLGKSAAMFFPSATMANQIAIRLHCQPHIGAELIADENAHVFFAEAGGPAVNSGVMAKSIRTENGVFTGEEVRRAYRSSKGPHYPVSCLVNVENTTNMGGGVAWPADALDSVITTAKELELKTHMDGSRLFNAVVKTGLSAKEIASRFDTVTVCLSKGLGCPTGAVLGYDKEDFDKIRRLKQLMGGAMRQSGVLAAAGIYALTHNIERLKEDHENATRLAQGLAQGIPHIRVETTTPSTNMVYFRWTSQSVPVERLIDECERRGVRFSDMEPNRIRLVTHLDIKASDIDQAVQVIKSVCEQF